MEILDFVVGDVTQAFRQRRHARLREIQQRKAVAMVPSGCRRDDRGTSPSLFAEYEPRCYLFVVFECIRRNFMHSVHRPAHLRRCRGSLTQITIGLLLAFSPTA